jgi:hypothetical protein
MRTRAQTLQAGKPPVGTPGGTPAAAAAAAGRTTPAVRSRSAFGGAAARSRHGARAAAAGGGGLRSEPTSPRGSASVADSEACMLDELLEGAGSGGGGGGSSDNIRVFVRVRPANAREQGSTAEAPRSCVSISGGRMVVLSDPARPEPFIASFDRVFDPEAGQEEVFSAVGAQMVDNCMAGGRWQKRGRLSSACGSCLHLAGGSCSQACRPTSLLLLHHLYACLPASLQASTRPYLCMARQGRARPTPSPEMRSGRRRGPWRSR